MVVKKPKIVIGDSIFLEEKHIKRLNKLGETIIYEDTPESEEEIIERAKGANIAIFGWSDLTKNILEKLPELWLISYWATGYDYVDVRTAAEKGIAVCNVPGYASEAVAEHVFGLILAYIRKIPQAFSYVKSGKFNWKEFRGTELMGKTLGIIGTGSIGSRVAEIAKCFKMNVIAYTAHPNAEKEKRFGVKFVDMDTLLTESDIISLHLPLKKETEKMFGREEFKKMKKSAILVNTSRGKIIDEDALTNALKSNEIAGACLDVLAVEKPRLNSELIEMNNVLITPHIAFHTKESLIRCTDICIDNIESFLNGSSINVVNPEYIKNARFKK